MHRTALAILSALVLLVSGCATPDANLSTPATEVEDSDEDVIDYGIRGPLDGPLHEVTVDGETHQSRFTQKNLDLAGKEEITREQYESAFLDFASCIEDRGGWIHYDLQLEIVKYTYTTNSDPHSYCYNSHFYFPDGIWQSTHFHDDGERIRFLIDCVKDHDVEPIHAAAADPGPEQTEQTIALERQIREEALECGEYVDSFYEDAPYPE